MLMLAAALLAQAAVAAAPQPKAITPSQKPAGQVGACAWNRLELADRTRILEAYHRDRNEGLSILVNLDGPVDAALRACAPRGNVASVFLHRAIWAEMTQTGAAREVASAGVDRAGLDAAWTRSAQSARTCLHNRLGPNFGEATPNCADDAEGDMAKGLNIQSVRLREQASIYFLAKAEAEWAETLIANSPF
ncbi:MAG TPA: hypothetical protein VFN88_07325 [Caulobacteraceae bacterium]|nr:hypothetical protein [Caulobacteraceae bacterium]